MTSAIDRAVRRARRTTYASEDDDLVTLVAALKAGGRVVFDPRLVRSGQVLAAHVENERKTTHGAGARRKAKGVCPGVPDLVFFDRTLRVLELKTMRGSTSDAQRAFLEYAGERGYETALARGLDAALAQCRAWGYLP